MQVTVCPRALISDFLQKWFQISVIKIKLWIFVELDNSSSSNNKVEKVMKCGTLPEGGSVGQTDTVVCDER